MPDRFLFRNILRTPLNMIDLMPATAGKATASSFQLPAGLLLCCAPGRYHAAHHTERHPGRVNHRQLSDLHTKRPKACIGRLLMP